MGNGLNWWYTILKINPNEFFIQLIAAHLEMAECERRNDIAQW